MAEEENIPHKLPGKLWKTVGTDIFTLNSNNYICILDYHNRFPIVKLVEKLSVDDQIQCCQIVFAEYGLPRRIISDL